MTTSVESKYFPVLETERLILRQMTLEDTDFVFQHFSDPAVSRYLMDEAPVTEYAQARRSFNSIQPREARLIIAGSSFETSIVNPLEHAATTSGPNHISGLKSDMT